ncbi:MAG TPA: cytochrome c-type biogenesis protein [Baekduia sp.]|nr:cytochrome c-type biogenesis protein [Baekduia sp.]
MRRVALAATLAALLLTVIASGAVQAAPAQRTSLHAVESEVMCVSCGVALAIAESPQADAERREITRLIKQGKTKQEILDSLVGTYGDRVLASPKDKGFGLAAYLVPIAIVLAMLAGLAVYLPRWRRNRDPEDSAIAAEGPALTDADSQRLAEDLARYDV